MDVATRTDAAAEAQIDAFIERREKQNDVSPAEARAILWKESERRHKAATRRRNRALWFAHFCTMAENHAALAQDYQRRAEALCSEAKEGAQS